MLKHGLVPASLALVVGTTAGCGDPPTDASVEDFCAAHKSLLSHTSDMSDNPSHSEAVEAAANWGEEMADVGTPEGIPDQARRGFELTVEDLAYLEDVDLEEPEKALAEHPGRSDEDLMAVKVYTQYAQTTCPVGVADLELLQ